VLALFQSWKLWVDDRVDEAAPVGAVQIPAETDLSRYVSVVIWCDRFNSAFGAAPLN